MSSLPTWLDRRRGAGVARRGARAAGLFGLFAGLLVVLALAGDTSAAICGRPQSGDGPAATLADCSAILRHALIPNSGVCVPPCICDVDGSNAVTPTDVLLCMQAAIGLPVSFRCSCTTETRDQRLWPFDALSPWNYPLGSGATFAADDDVLTVDLHAGRTAINTKNYSHPVFLATSSDPLQTVTVQGSSGRMVSYRIPLDAVPAGGSDAHMHVIDPDGNIVHETWRATQTGVGTWSVASYKEIDLRGSGIASRASENVGTRAYGGSAIAGLIRTWEIEDAGEIRHALAVSLMKSQLQAGPVWPATAQDPPSQYSGHIPMGTLIAIKSDVDVESLGLTPAGLMVARALQNYGAYAVDTGSNGPAFYAEPDLDPAYGRQIAGDLPRLLALLYPVTNNRADNVGGGGAPRAAMAPPFAGGN